MGSNLAAHLRLMLVTDDALVGDRDLVSLARAAERGGVTCLQLRLKQLSARAQVTLARALVQALGIPVLVNDRPDIALAAGAAGVHLGDGDLPVHLTRRIVPSGFTIGATAGTEGEVLTSAEADYWGIGPWRTTVTKADAGAALGPSGFARLAAMGRGRPCIAIGGVRPDDAARVRDAGGCGLAVVSGILAAADVEAAARRYRRAIDLAWPD